jgi:hypothetical protein
MRKVVNWCYMRQQWFVWDRVLKAEVGWFATREAAVQCAQQGELF